MLTRLRQIVSGYKRKVLDPGGKTPAAVLVPLILRNDELFFLMEKRTDLVDHHKGQVSFPGGRTDPEDRDPVATALRESQEEVGLSPHQVEVFGMIDDIATITNFLVTPVVASIPAGVKYELSRFEVEEVIEVPWGIFTQAPDHHRMMEHDGTKFEVNAYEFERHLIWGATARITRSLVELVESGCQVSRQEAS